LSKVNNHTIGIFLAPSPKGPGMIKSPPLDIANLMAILKRNEKYNIKLFDLRINIINNEFSWERKGIYLNIFNDFKRCFNHILVKRDPLVSYISRKILKEINLENMRFLIFSVAVLEQFSLQYLVSSLSIAKELKAIKPEIKLLFFGNCPKKHVRIIMKNFRFLDAFLEDGNEFSALDYIKNAEAKQSIPGICIRENNELIFSNLKRKLNLNHHLLPDFSFFNIESYKSNNKLVLPYEVSRGCINNCFFCYYIHKNKISYKNIDKVIRDLRALSDKYNTPYFHFMDAAINFDENYLNELCDRFAKKLPNLKWSALAIPNINYELLVKLKMSGCIQLRWGVEYGSERMLKIIGKKTNLRGIKETLKNSHNLGIYNYITLLSGLETEREKDIERTKEFIRDMFPYIDSAKECVWGELGHFSIVNLDSLLSNRKRTISSDRERYSHFLRNYKIPSEDIIEIMTS
jgi:hypothetical protein